jgi:hypothetical protein
MDWAVLSSIQVFGAVCRRGEKEADETGKRVMPEYSGNWENKAMSHIHSADNSS